VQLVDLVLQKALAQSQFPDFLVLDNGFDGLFALRKAQFEVGGSQRMA
jgi:hypothetical protein